MNPKLLRMTEACPNCGENIPRRAHHCPNCLWRWHRRAERGCGGPMHPVGVSVNRRRCIIHYRCSECGSAAHHITSVHDRFDAIVEVAVSAHDGTEQPRIKGDRGVTSGTWTPAA